MRIEPTSGQPPVTQTQSTAARPGARPAEGGATEPATFTPTAELAGLLQAVQASPDIRTDVIESVTARLNAGELATIQAAQEAAKAALSTGDLNPPAEVG